MSAEVVRADTWQPVTFPSTDGHQLAKDVYNNVYAPSIVYREAMAFFESQPTHQHLTLVCGGMVVPPDRGAFHVARNTIERVSALLNNRNTDLLEDNEDVPVYIIGGDTPVILRRPLPSLAEVHAVRRISSHDALMRAKQPQVAFGIGYVALHKTRFGLSTLVGYGNLQNGERAEKALDLSAVHKRRTLQGKRTETLTNIAHVSGLGPLL